MSEVQVTVYCAAYNHRKYIRDALDSFVNQKTSFDFEIIVHDDASSDGTADIIKEYELKYPDLIKPIYQKENMYSRGERIFLNFALPLARGKYIAFCEGDDYWIDRYKLQKQFDYAEVHPECSLVAHKSLKYYEAENFFAEFSAHSSSNPENLRPTAEMLIADHMYFHTSSMFFRTELYRQNRAAYESVTGRDYVLKILLAAAGSVYVIPEYMSVYRFCSDGSWTERILGNNKKYSAHIGEDIDIFEKINKFTNYRYNDAIQKKILIENFRKQAVLSNKAALKEEKYKFLLRELSAKQKFTVYMQMYAPRIYKLILRLLNPVKVFVLKRKNRHLKLMFPRKDS